MKIFFLVLFWSTFALANGPSLRAISGLKYPNEAEEGEEAVETTVWTQTSTNYPGFSELIPYLHRAPHQQDAGSCLYMSLTGIAEFWLAKLHPNEARIPDGPIDLSERYLMNLSGVHEAGNGVLNWKTDSIQLFNRAKAVPTNAGYRFTKGWVRKDARGEYAHATANQAGAQYSTTYNWIDDRKSADAKSFVALPFFQRDVIFADPASDVWNVAVAPKDLVARIKQAMMTRKAPVHVIYNHYGYWHAVNIVGFDDNADTRQCTFVTGFIAHMDKQAKSQRAQANAAVNPAEKLRLSNLAAKSEGIHRKVSAAYLAGGGCQPRGMFYVRDSLYGDPSGPLYDYDLVSKGEETVYPKTVVLHEYDWVQYMANHATQIYVK